MYKNQIAYHTRKLTQLTQAQAEFDAAIDSDAAQQYDAIKRASSSRYPIPYYCAEDPADNLRPVVGCWYAAQNVKAECYASPEDETPPRGLTDERYFRNWATL